MKQFIIISLLSSVVMMTGCKKQTFELPYESLSPEQAFATPQRIEKSAIGMYNLLQGANYFGGRILIYSDIRADDTNIPTYFGNIPLHGLLLSNDGTVQATWQAAYRAIYEANLFIKSLSAKPGVVDAAKENQYFSEAKFIRALCYFYLVNMWAQPYNFTAGATHAGVPLVLEPADGGNAFGPDQQLPRATVAAIYTQMEKDLTEAEAGLPSTYNSPAYENIARATKAAAQALLMRVYLYKEDWAKANTYADKVIATNQYSLAATPDVPFRITNSGTNKESIFSVGMNGADNPNTNAAIGQHYSPTGRADITVSSSYLNLPGFSATDLRRTMLTTVASGATWTTKFRGITDWVPVVRYAEVLLTKAEALARINTATPDAAAITLLNQIRSRSGATTFVAGDFATSADLVNTILLERKIELAFEGQGSLDYLRTKRGIPARGVVGAQAWGSDFVVFPIPLVEMQRNPNLVQNPGY